MSAAMHRLEDHSPPMSMMAARSIAMSTWFPEPAVGGGTVGSPPRRHTAHVPSYVDIFHGVMIIDCGALRRQSSSNNQIPTVRRVTTARAYGDADIVRLSASSGSSHLARRYSTVTHARRRRSMRARNTDNGYKTSVCVGIQSNR